MGVCCRVWIETQQMNERGKQSHADTLLKDLKWGINRFSTWMDVWIISSVGKMSAVLVFTAFKKVISMTPLGHLEFKFRNFLLSRNTYYGKANPLELEPRTASWSASSVTSESSDWVSEWMQVLVQDWWNIAGTDRTGCRKRSQNIITHDLFHPKGH